MPFSHYPKSGASDRWTMGIFAVHDEPLIVVRAVEEGCLVHWMRAWWVLGDGSRKSHYVYDSICREISLKSQPTTTRMPVTCITCAALVMAYPEFRTHE